MRCLVEDSRFVRGSMKTCRFSGTIQELMILERTREMRRSFAKERANADTVIQFLSQREREDRDRRELVHMKQTVLLVRRAITLGEEGMYCLGHFSDHVLFYFICRIWRKRSKSGRLKATSCRSR